MVLMHNYHTHKVLVASLLRIDSEGRSSMVCKCLILSGCLAIQAVWKLPLHRLGSSRDGHSNHVHWSPEGVVGLAIAYMEAIYFV